MQERVPVTGPDGTTSSQWGDQTEILGKIQPAGGRLMAEMYGERVAGMLSLLTEEGAPITEAQGVCVDRTDEPDYRVVAVRSFGGVTVADLEKVRR